MAAARLGLRKDCQAARTGALLEENCKDDGLFGQDLPPGVAKVHF